MDDYSRVKYASGKTTEEMLELRQGIIREVADVVVHPRDKHDVQKIVEYCDKERIPDNGFQRRFFGEFRLPSGQRRCLSGHQHAHEQTSGSK